MNNNSLNGTSATSTSTTYNISNTCKYRLPCGWCDRRNCLCTYAGLGYTYTTTHVTGADFGSVYQTRSDSVDGVVTTASNSVAKSGTVDDNRVDVGAENRGFVATTETFLQR